MPYSVFLAEFVEVRIEIVRIDLEVVMQKSAQIGVAVRSVGHDLDTVAGGDHHALFDSWIGGEIATGVGQARLGNRQALANLQGCALMIHADELVSHDAANLWIAEK